MNDYKSAFNAAAADLSAIIALLGFTKYPGVDPVLRAITDLILEKAENQVLREERDAANKRADTLEHRMMGMMTRHFAETWRNRDTEKALDGYLSAGIAQLEQERDAALANVDALAVQVLKLGGTISFAHHRTDQAGQVPQAWLDVQAERRRQVEAEGWTPEHDDAHDTGALASAAGCYAMFSLAYPAGDPSRFWPWDKSWWKPSPDGRRNMVKAGALILAEIERLDRAAASQGGPSDA
ncbi:hypothetical protein ACM7N9_29540 [Pseudomonas aeruginosa]